jgi:hypothetical protein
MLHMHAGSQLFFGGPQQLVWSAFYSVKQQAAWHM